ncbi:MAG: hypothetical protein A2068_01980 [Ignavibacteria bacterium GWB2_35_6b]|nr:MAG: hypothetical protein A2068_01980 [Ignavibacteria bacterium GWB2_35_6b]
MKPTLYLILFILFQSIIYPQLYDSFSDGDFTSNPVWSGDTGDWQVVTSSAAGVNTSGSQTLRLNATVAADGTKYLSSQISGSWGTEQSWGLWMGRRSPVTTTNQSVIWLWSNESNLTSSTIDGYRILIGDNTDDDEIVLEKIDNGAITVVITSSGVISNGLTDYGLLIRVTRTSGSVWTLYTSSVPIANSSGAIATDLPSSTNTTINQGSSTDNSYTNFDNGYIGFVCTYTSSNRDAAEFDQIYFDTDASSSLPVELLNFNSKLLNDKVLLTWETATEINNYGFEVEKQITNEKLEIINWEVIGFVNGHGNSNSNKYYSFTDNHPFSGENFYRLKQIDFDGSYEYSEAVGISFMKSKPNFSLEQNYPNPFNPITKISFNIPNVVDAFNASTTLSVYNILGELVATLVNQNLLPGKYEIEFDGSNLSSGVYYYSLVIGNFIQTKKMLLLR